MKNTSIVTILLIFFCFSGYSQTFTKFPTDCNPKSVDASTIAKDAKSLLSTTGFQNIYFSKADIEDLMTEASVGVRFYICKAASDQPYADVMAVSIDASGNELKGKNVNRQYLYTMDVNTRFLYNALGVNSAIATSRVANLKSGTPKVDYYTSYLGKETLKILINTQGADGVRIFPATTEVDGQNYRTMGFGAVKVAKGSINDLSNTYLLATHPCPVQCGGSGGQYLWDN